LSGNNETNPACRCASDAGHLTLREIQVLLLIASGMSNHRIAPMLHISVRTVDQHLITMLRRAGAMNRTELIARCYAASVLRQGIWPPTWSGTRCLAVPVVA
jgi:DNA-binding NarL/FixJ family response regulator